MRKTRLIFYWATLVLLMFLYYGIIETLYQSSIININEGSLGAQFLAVYFVPLNLVLGIVRLWLLKPVNKRWRLLNASYFVIPVLLIIVCLAAQFWLGIILSALAGILIVFEFIRSIVHRAIRSSNLTL